MKLSDHYIYLVKYNLKRLKKEKQWTITKMSLLLSISESHLSHILSYKSNKVPSIYILGIICEKSNIEINYFFEKPTKKE